MLPLLTCDEMRAAEGEGIAAGIPGRVLMENAASAAVSIIKKENPREVFVFCGSGNCAGDGFATARRLLISGIASTIVLVGTTEKLSEDAGENLAAARACGVPVIEFDALPLPLPKDAYIVDALLGIGASREVLGKFRDAIE